MTSYMTPSISAFAAVHHATTRQKLSKFVVRLTDSARTGLTPNRGRWVVNGNPNSAIVGHALDQRAPPLERDRILQRSLDWPDRYRALPSDD